MDNCVCVSLNFNASAYALHGHGETLESPEYGVTHRGVEMRFNLCLTPKNEDDSGNGRRIEVSVQCSKKPEKTMLAHTVLTMVKEGVADVGVRSDWPMVGMKPSVVVCILPRTYHLLRDGGYLSIDKRFIHPIVDIYINDSEFPVEGERLVLEKVVDETGFDLFKSIDVEHAGRIRLTCGGGKVFWVHKEIMFAMSGLFKDLFDESKPRSAWSQNLVEGRYEVDSLNEFQMRHLLEFVYTKQSSPSFADCASDLLVVADQLMMPRLKQQCYTYIMGVLDQMSVGDLVWVLRQANFVQMEGLTNGVAFQLCQNLRTLTGISDECLRECVVFGRENNFPMLIESVEVHLGSRLETLGDRVFFKHLLSVALEMNLNRLRSRCLAWFRDHYGRLIDIGYVNSDIISDPVMMRNVLDCLAQ